MESEEADIPPTGDNPHRQKRSRVLLSCAPCRNSKLKCDRGQPCSQCLKKDRVDLCAYAPKPEKRRPAKGVAARLKRLETMVRGMMDGDGNIDRLASQLQRQLPELSGRKEGELPLPPAQDGNVVKGSNSTTYIGATHCMAMLEDIEDLKEYFDYPDDEDEGDSPGGPLDESGEWIMLSGGVPIDRQELLSKLPEKQVMDRLIVRYFASMSPSQHVVHRPTFTKAYAKFSQNPETASYHWIAQLFMVLAMGIHFNKYQNADETYNDSPVPLDERIKQYRACAGWALVRGRFTQPTFQTLPAFLLYCESHFLFNRAAQMSCYLLSGVLMRLMLKMGLHRDPSKLTNIGPFEGEMRRRVWNMGTQLEAIVSFHVGLPSMIPAIETDVRLPHNLHDEDLNEDCEELPRERPHTDWTVMTYPIHKSRLLAVFSKIGRQAHALQSPIYTEVLRLDEILTETWRSIPSYMYVLPLEDCVGDPPGLLIQRFGLGSLYNKTRCILHRRYLAEPVPKKEHDFSRQQCLEGAMTLLEYQRIISDACLPGHLLGQNGWFISSLVIHDYLLAAMVIYLVIQNEHYAAQDSEYCWYARGGTSPTKEELKDMLRKSHHIWSTVAEDMAELRKTADTIGVMLERLGEPVEGPPTTVWKTRLAKAGESGSNSAAGSFDAATGTSGSERQAASSSWGYDSSTSGMNSGPDPFTVAQAMNGGETMDIPSVNMNGDQDDMIDPAWMADLNDMDWRYLDVSLAHSQTAGLNAEPGAGSTWTERMPLNNMSDLESVPMNLWGHQDGVWMSNNGTNGL